jgi:hypothetical protein
VSNYYSNDCDIILPDIIPRIIAYNKSKNISPIYAKPISSHIIMKKYLSVDISAIASPNMIELSNYEILRENMPKIMISIYPLLAIYCIWKSMQIFEKNIENNNINDKYLKKQILINHSDNMNYLRSISNRFKKYDSNQLIKISDP